MRKLLIVILTLVLQGFSYGKLSKENIVIDMTEYYDVMSVLSDAREMITVDYCIDEEGSKILIDIKYNGSIQ